jgi:hypothetical protein
MSNRRSFTVRASLALALLCSATNSLAQEKWALCKPVETMSYATRVHVKCATPVDGVFWYFAASTQDARFASRMLNVSMVGQVAEKTLAILFDPADQSGAAFGCQPNDCRTARAVGISEAAAPEPARPVRPDRRSTAREECLAICKEKEDVCSEDQPGRPIKCETVAKCQSRCPKQ